MRSRRASYYFIREKYEWLEEEKRREEASKGQGAENPQASENKKGISEEETQSRLNRSKEETTE